MERFWRKVLPDEQSDCWLWTGSRLPTGYGLFRLASDQSPTGAHRVAWLLSGRTIEDDQHILHICDNPPCVNPQHLFAGTAQDNARDSVGKGRHPNSLGRRPRTKPPQESRIFISVRAPVALLAHIDDLALASGQTRTKVALDLLHEGVQKAEGEPPVPICPTCGRRFD